MYAQQIEELLAAAACAAYGVLLLAVAPERLPAGLRVKPENRLMWGVLLILLGVALCLFAVLGNAPGG